MAANVQQAQIAPITFPNERFLLTNFLVTGNGEREISWVHFKEADSSPGYSPIWLRRACRIVLIFLGFLPALLLDLTLLLWLKNHPKERVPHREDMNDNRVQLARDETISWKDLQAVGVPVSSINAFPLAKTLDLSSIKIDDQQSLIELSQKLPSIEKLILQMDQNPNGTISLLPRISLCFPNIRAIRLTHTSDLHSPQNAAAFSLIGQNFKNLASLEIESIFRFNHQPHNYDTAIEEFAKYCPSISTLSLVEGRVTGRGLKALEEFRQLTRLHIHNGGFSNDEFIRYVKTNRGLQCLTLGDCPDLQNSGLEELFMCCARLHSLFLAANLKRNISITNDLLLTRQALPHLRNLALSGTSHFTPITRTHLENCLRQCPNLEEFHYFPRQLQVTDEELRELEEQFPDFIIGRYGARKKNVQA